MTLKDIALDPRDMLRVSDIAPVLGTDPQSLRTQIWEDREAVGFPVIIVGRRIVIPRDGFVNYCRGNIKLGGI